MTGLCHFSLQYAHSSNCTFTTTKKCATVHLNTGPTTFLLTTPLVPQPIHHWIVEWLVTNASEKVLREAVMSQSKYISLEAVRKTSVRTAGVLTNIWTKHLLNSSLKEYYHYTNFPNSDTVDSIHHSIISVHPSFMTWIFVIFTATVT
jgi:hypothetical protein